MEVLHKTKEVKIDRVKKIIVHGAIKCPGSPYHNHAFRLTMYEQNSGSVYFRIFSVGKGWQTFTETEDYNGSEWSKKPFEERQKIVEKDMNELFLATGNSEDQECSNDLQN